LLGMMYKTKIKNKRNRAHQAYQPTRQCAYIQHTCNTIQHNTQTNKEYEYKTNQMEFDYYSYRSGSIKDSDRPS
jgi:hypothetical protein